MKKLSRTLMLLSLIFLQSPVQAGWDDCLWCACCLKKRVSSVGRQPSAALNEEEVRPTQTKVIKEKNISLELEKKSSEQVAETLHQTSIKTFDELNQLSSAFNTIKESPPAHSKMPSGDDAHQKAIITINTITIGKPFLGDDGDNEKQVNSARVLSHLNQQIHWHNDQQNDFSLFNGGNQEIIRDLNTNTSAPVALAHKPTILLAEQMISRAPFYADPTLSPNCEFSNEAWILLKKKCRLPTVKNATLRFDGGVSTINEVHNVLPNVEYLCIKAPNLKSINKKDDLLEILSLKEITIESNHKVGFSQKGGSKALPFKVSFKKVEDN